MIDTLSRRGARSAQGRIRIDLDLFSHAVQNLYHPEANPDGALTLNVAENKLGWSELSARLQTLSARHPIPGWVSSYTASRGAPRFREALAGFLSRHLAGCDLDPGCVCVSAGATSVIELVAFILAEAGDVAVIPAPAYPVYRVDLGSISGVERYDLVTHGPLTDLRDGPTLTVDDLERARAEIESAGNRFRMLVLTTPDNPTGLVYPIELLREIADWCMAREIHLVVNEIYGLSLIDTDHPDLRDDYRDPAPFVSFATVIEERQSDYLHLLYALSKDLGISGFRVGAAYSRSAGFSAAYENLNLSHAVSNHTQWLLGLVLNDEEFMADYLGTVRARLTESYASVVRTMRSLGIPYVPARGSLFAWIDLSGLLREDSEDGELTLWRELYDETGVLLTPGVGFGHAGHGYFRLVHPCVAPDALEVALRRISRFVESRRAEPASG